MASKSERSRPESSEAVVEHDVESPEIPVVESKASSPVIEDPIIEILPEENVDAQEQQQANENQPDAVLAPMKRVPKVFNKQSNMKLLKPLLDQKPGIGPKEMTKPAPIKSTHKKPIAVRFDSDGDSVHDYEDYSNEKTKKDCKKESSTEAKAAKHKLNVIDSTLR